MIPRTWEKSARYLRNILRFLTAAHNNLNFLFSAQLLQTDISHIFFFFSFLMQLPDVPLKTRKLVARVSDIITRRAARLAAAAIVAILQKIGCDGTLCGSTQVRTMRGVRRRTVVAIEGGLFEGYSVFREYLNEALVEILGEEIAATVSLRVMEEGSGTGAALLAAAYSSARQKNSE